MKSFLLNILVLCLICVRLSAQEKFDAKLFESLNNQERYTYALKIVSVIERDSIQLTKYLQRGGAIARQKEDHATEVLLQMQYFNYLYYMRIMG